MYLYVRSPIGLPSVPRRFAEMFILCFTSHEMVEYCILVISSWLEEFWKCLSCSRRTRFIHNIEVYTLRWKINSYSFTDPNIPSVSGQFYNYLANLNKAKIDKLVNLSRIWSKYIITLLLLGSLSLLMAMLRPVFLKHNMLLFIIEGLKFLQINELQKCNDMFNAKGYLNPGVVKDLSCWMTHAIHYLLIRIETIHVLYFRQI